MAQPSRTPGRYTVVYEGDPRGVRILDGEPAPGKPLTVGFGDAFDSAAKASNDHMAALAKGRACEAEKADLLAALRQLNAFAKKAATLDYSEDITVMGIAHYTAHVDALILKSQSPLPTGAVDGAGEGR